MPDFEEIPDQHYQHLALDPNMLAHPLYSRGKRGGVGGRRGKHMNLAIKATRSKDHLMKKNDVFPNLKTRNWQKHYTRNRQATQLKKNNCHFIKACMIVLDRQKGQSSYEGYQKGWW